MERKDGDTEIAENEDQNEPDVEALKDENNHLRETIRVRDAREQIRAALKSVGARYPELLFESAKESLQFGDDGRLENAAAIVGDLKRKFPDQFASQAPITSIDGGAGAGREPNILTKESLARMSPAEIARLDWADVRQVLSSR